MTPEEQRRFAALDAAWEGVVRGSTDVSDAADDETLRLLRGLYLLFAPSTTFGNWDELWTHPIETVDRIPGPEELPSGFDELSRQLPGVNALSGPAGSQPKERRWLAWLSAAALFAIAAGAILLVALQSRDASHVVGPATPAAAPTVEAQGSSTGWSVLRGGAGRTGATSDAGPSTAPAIAWQTGLLWSTTPLVSDGVLYSATSHGAVSAYDVATGDVMWESADVVNSCSASALFCLGLAADQTRLFVAGQGNRVAALDRSNGAVLWAVDVGYRPDGGPLPVDDMLLLQTNDGGLLALDAATGALRWSLPTQYASDGFRQGPAFADGVAYTAIGGGNISAIRIADQQLLWTFRIEGGGLAAAPVIADGIVYVTGYDAEPTLQGLLVARDASTGEELWRFEGPDRLSRTSWPAVDAQHVYVSTADGAFHALDAKTGEERWGFQFPTKTLEAATVAGSTVLVPLQDRRLAALDAATGELMWTVWTGYVLAGGPVVAGDVIYGAANEGPIMALRAIEEESTPDSTP